LSVRHRGRHGAPSRFREWSDGRSGRGWACVRAREVVRRSGRTMSTSALQTRTAVRQCRASRRIRADRCSNDGGLGRLGRP
jgi:hypothetical protein